MTFDRRLRKSSKIRATGNVSHRRFFETDPRVDQDATPLRRYWPAQADPRGPRHQLPLLLRRPTAAAQSYHRTEGSRFLARADRHVARRAIIARRTPWHVEAAPRRDRRAAAGRATAPGADRVTIAHDRARRAACSLRCGGARGCPAAHGDDPADGCVARRIDRSAV